MMAGYDPTSTPPLPETNDPRSNEGDPLYLKPRSMASQRIVTEFDAARHSGTVSDPWLGKAFATAYRDLPSYGGTCLVPSDNYLFNPDIAVYAAGFLAQVDMNKSNTHFKGVLGNKLLMKSGLTFAVNTGPIMFFIDDIGHASVKGLWMDGNKPNITSTYATGVWTQQSTVTNEYVRVMENYFRQFDRATYGDGAVYNGFEVLHNFFPMNHYGIAISLHNLASRSVVGENVIDDALYGMLLDSVSNCSVVMNTLRKPANIGIELYDGANGNTVGHNTVTDIPGTGVAVDMYTDPATLKPTCDMNTYVANAILRCPFGFRLHGKGNLLSDNLIDDDNAGTASQVLQLGIYDDVDLSTLTRLRGNRVNGYTRAAYRVSPLNTFLEGNDIWYSRANRLSSNEPPFDTSQIVTTGVAAFITEEGRGVWEMQSGITSGSIGGRRPGGAAGIVTASQKPFFLARSKLVDTTQLTYMFGLANSIASIPPSDGIFVRADPVASAVNWKLVTRAGAAETETDFGAGVLSSTSYMDFAVHVVDDKGTPTVVGELFDGSAWYEAVATAHIPSAGLMPVIAVLSKTIVQSRGRTHSYSLGLQTP